MQSLFSIHVTYSGVSGVYGDNAGGWMLFATELA